MPTPSPLQAPRHALVVIPGTVNYFYNLNGRRIAEALTALGYTAEVSTLEACSSRDYDLCVLSNIAEILHAAGDKARGMSLIKGLRRRCRTLATCSIDCVATAWYSQTRRLSARVGADMVLDLGMHDQTPLLRRADRSSYRFVFSGLTMTEQRQLDASDRDDSVRTIPWAFVGHATAHRAALVDHLIQTVDPRGFVYLPALAPYAEQGSPHLNQHEFERVLRQTRYQVWCSHHSHFYMEPERFRTSLLMGNVPVKIVASRASVPSAAPLGYLMLEPHEVGERLTAAAFGLLRRRLIQDWRRFPTLSEALGRVLCETGVPAAEVVPVAGRWSFGRSRAVVKGGVRIAGV